MIKTVDLTKKYGEMFAIRGIELDLEQGDLFLPIGVIHPGPGDQQPSGGVGGQEHLHGPVAALHQGNRIF